MDIIAPTNQQTDLESLVPQYEALRMRVCELEKNTLKQDTIISSLNQCVQKHENLSIASDLRIDGIPFVDNEDLTTIFNNICTAIGFSPPIVKSIFRFKKFGRNPRTNKNTTIIVKLYTPTEKNDLLYRASQFRRNNKCTLSLRQAGFDSDASIYINESLSKTNHALLKAALQLKKENKIYAAYTHRGRIYIKTENNASPVHISSINSLIMLPNNSEMRGNSDFFRDPTN